MVNKTRVCVVLCGGAFKSVEKSHANTYSRILYSKKRVYSDKQKRGEKEIISNFTPSKLQQQALEMRACFIDPLIFCSL